MSLVPIHLISRARLSEKPIKRLIRRLDPQNYRVPKLKVCTLSQQSNDCQVPFLSPNRNSGLSGPLSPSLNRRSTLIKESYFTVTLLPVSQGSTCDSVEAHVWRQRRRVAGEYVLGFGSAEPLRSGSYWRVRNNFVFRMLVCRLDRVPVTDIQKQRQQEAVPESGHAQIA